MDAPNTARVADITVGELQELIRQVVREALAEQVPGTPEGKKDQRGILDIPPLHLDPRHPALTALGREDMYGDEGR